MDGLRIFDGSLLGSWGKSTLKACLEQLHGQMRSEGERGGVGGGSLARAASRL